MSDFTPSKYQEDIFSHVRKGEGDALVTARAGSGKTSTLVHSAKQLTPWRQSKAGFAAFNKHIAEELKRKLPASMDCFTVHSLGYQALRKHFNPRDTRNWVMGNKYRKLARNYWTSRGVDLLLWPETLDATLSLLRFVMLTLTDSNDINAVETMAGHFGVWFPFFGRKYERPIEPYFEAVQKLSKWGLKGTPDESFGGAEQCISYDDMLYYVNTLDIPVPQYEVIFVDEAQDLSAAAREFLLKVRSPGGFMTFVGDDRQAIYQFAGADARSFEEIRERTLASGMTLPICYRCPSTHLDLARAIVPDILARDNAPEGLVAEIQRKDLLGQTPAHVREGDLIICRCTAPLIDLCFSLISVGVPARVRGREIGASLNRIVQAVASQDEYTWLDFPRVLDDYTLRMCTALGKKEDNDLAIEEFSDRAQSVETIYFRAAAEGVQNAEHLQRYIDTLFNDERGTVQLSTIHKAKGLECERVFLYRPDLLPHPKALKPWEVLGEQNLRYVGLTRSKSDLYFVEDPDA